MIVRKLKNPSHNAKIEALQEGTLKVPKRIPEDMRMSLSKTIGSSQNIISLKKSRSTSALKHKLNQMISANATPLNKKSHNKSHLTTELSDIMNLSKASMSSNDSKQCILISIETWLSDQVKTSKASQKYLPYLEALKKLISYDSNIKSLLTTIISGLEDIFKPIDESPQLILSAEVETEKCRSQITELRNSIKELVHEKKTYKNNLDQFNLILGYMKKQGVPVEQYIQEYCQSQTKKDKNPSLSSSLKILPNCSDTKAKAGLIPKLNIIPPSGAGFHQEFMAKAEEFSESWRQLLKSENSS
ncbi:hypothetical protein SteCoe_36602 [Stentor coeruleus]|uniref:Uncharacterized protein n=1 Tax=Stentor coeruleus TaxID=5963 RepID=A0A1R2APS6_9CILI|nr:hypothetical protein SteCoe_36602 [Stentor coeruleus]